MDPTSMVEKPVRSGVRGPVMAVRYGTHGVRKQLINVLVKDYLCCRFFTLVVRGIFSSLLCLNLKRYLSHVMLSNRLC